MYLQLWLCKGSCMPTYNYYCSDCDSHFSYFQKMSESPISICESCGGEVKRLISGGSGLIFKGSGFYLTDYKNVQKSAEKKSNSAQNKNENSKLDEKEKSKDIKVKERPSIIAKKEEIERSKRYIKELSAKKGYKSKRDRDNIDLLNINVAKLERDLQTLYNEE